MPVWHVRLFFPDHCAVPTTARNAKTEMKFSLKLFFAAALFCAVHIALFSLSAQTVTTFVPPGNGMDDDMLLDSAGNIFTSGYDNGRLYKVTPAGVVSTYALGFSSCNGLAWDGLGNLVVVDNVAGRLYKIAPDTSITIFLDLNGISGIIKDPLSDTLYVTQYLGNAIWKVAPDTSMTLLIQGNGMNGPVGLDWAENGDLIVGNFNNSGVYRVTRTGAISFIGLLNIQGRQGFVAYKDGWIYGTGFDSNRIYRMDTSGAREYVAGTAMAGNLNGPAATARFNRPNGIIFSAGGDSLFITDYGAKSMRVLTGLDSIGFVAMTPRDILDASLEVSPNPARSATKLRFELPAMAEVRYQLLDAQGRQVHQVHTGLQPAGQLEIPVDVSNLAPGVYLLVLEAGEWRLARRLVVH